MKYIILESGKRIEDDGSVPYRISKDNDLYVFVPNGFGYYYEPFGKVKEIIEEEEE